MKKQLENTLAPLSNQIVENSTIGLEETIVRKMSQPKLFTAVDMWNIRRKSVSMFQRRNCA